MTIAAEAYAGVGSTGIGLTSDTASIDALSGIGPGGARHLGLQAAGARDPEFVGRVRADDDPADRAHHPVDGGLQGAAASRSATCSRRFQTPTVSTWAMGLVSIAFYVAMTYIKGGASCSTI